ncbi:uncharacterized protein LOC141906365 [Tubulanus polymorphus]|uniref:uncharacterized protein LOC141906365 n=1 Tax=Tubulanus polymorphus TaxID=672921 RepID=UPI003DA6AAC5
MNGSSVDYLERLELAKASLQDLSDSARGVEILEPRKLKTQLTEHLNNINESLKYVNEILVSTETVFQNLIDLQQVLLDRIVQEGKIREPALENIRDQLVHSTTALMPLVFPLSQKAGEIMTNLHESWQRNILHRDLQVLSSAAAAGDEGTRYRNHYELFEDEMKKNSSSSSSMVESYSSSTVRRLSWPETRLTLIDKWTATSTAKQVKRSNNTKDIIFKMADNDDVCCVIRTPTSDFYVDDFHCEQREIITANSLPVNASLCSKIVRVTSTLTQLDYTDQHQFEVFIPVKQCHTLLEGRRINLWTQFTDVIGRRETNVSESSTSTNNGNNPGHLRMARYCLPPFKRLVLCAYSIPATHSKIGENLLTRDEEERTRRLSFVAPAAAAAAAAAASSNSSPRGESDSFTNNTLSTTHDTSSISDKPIITISKQPQQINSTWDIIEQLLASSPGVQRKWRSLFRRVGLRSSEIATLYHENCHVGMCAVVAKAVSLWRQNACNVDISETCGRLYSALIRVQLNKTAYRLMALLRRLNANDEDDDQYDVDNENDDTEFDETISFDYNIRHNSTL